MARIRTIKPDFWTDDRITECSLSARLLFIGTWNVADDNGNLDRSSKQLKAKLFPHDSLEIEPLLLELIRQELVIEYEVCGQKFLHIKSFAKHQKINRPSAPSCPAYDDSLRTHGGITAGRERKGKEGKGRGVSRASLSPSSAPADGAPDPIADAQYREHGVRKALAQGFDEFWAAYPKKAGKDAARKAFAKVKVGVPILLRAIAEQKTSRQWQTEGGRYIPHPATWLNQGRWQDELPSGPAPDREDDLQEFVFEGH